MSEPSAQNADLSTAEQSARLTARLQMVMEVGRASLTKLNMGELLNSVAESVHRHFAYYDVTILLVDKEAQECVLVAQSGALKAEKAHGYRQKLSVGIVGWVAQHGQPVLCNDVRQDPRYFAAFKGEESLLSELAVPIRLHGGTVGVINVERREVSAFDVGDLTAMETLADQVAQAIANAQLFEQTRLLLELNSSIVESLPSGICVLDGSRRVLFANPIFCGLAGFDPQAAKGKSAGEVMANVLRSEPKLEGGISAALATGSTQSYQDVALSTPSGDKRLNIRVAPARMPEGAGALVVLEDVTELHRAAESLLHEKQKLEHVMSVLNAGLALIGRDRRIMWANRTIEEWFGGGRSVEGKRCHEVYCRHDHACVNCPADRCFQSGENHEVEAALFRSDGQMRQFHHAVTPVIGPDGKVDHILKLTLDVTEQSKKVYQLSRLRQFGEMLQGELDLDRLLHLVLTCVTAGQALGFNRAILMLVDKNRNVIEGRMGVGPGSAEEAGRIWSQITRDSPTLEDLLEHGGHGERESPMERAASRISIPMDDRSHIIVSCALGRKPMVVEDAARDQRVRDDLRQILGSNQFVMAPLISRNEPVGVIIADNIYSRQPITPEHVELLSMFANQAGSAIANAENYSEIQEEKSHLEEAYRDLGEAQERLVRSERLVAIGRMATHVAHEIRNPLVTVGGFANALLQKPDAPHEVVARYAQIISNEVRRLETILARVMDFTRPPQPALRQVELNPIIRSTLEQMQDRIAHQHANVTTDLPEPSVQLYLDADQMKQVFLNLFQNALDAMHQDGWLGVTVKSEQDKVVVTVSNSGEPVRPEDASKLFEPFYSTKPGGTGLGLAVTQKIVQDHGGDIRCLSSLERGTEFVITLPRRK